MGSISFGDALVTGKKRVPKPATGNTALRILVIVVSLCPGVKQFGAAFDGRRKNKPMSRDHKGLRCEWSALHGIERQSASFRAMRRCGSRLA